MTIAAAAAATPGCAGVVADCVRGQAGVPRALGQGDDVDLPAQRHVHLLVLPDVGYMNVRMSTTVPWPNPSEVFALTMFGAGHPADPDRDHDVRADHQQRHDGDGGQLRLPPRPRQTAALMLMHRRLRRDLRRHAGLRVDQADHRKACGPGATLGRGAVRLGVLHDHGLPRPARVGRRDLPRSSSR